MKFSSKQIIIVLAAFLVGVGIALMFNKNNANPPVPAPTANQPEAATQTATTVNPTQVETTNAPSGATSKTSATPATTAKPSTQFLSGSCTTRLSGYKNNKLNAIVLNWSPCASSNFQFYKLVKSTKNPNLKYPTDPVVYTSSNKNEANFVDKTVAARSTYYYRICVVERLGHVSCSNVATVSF